MDQHRISLLAALTACAVLAALPAAAAAVEAKGAYLDLDLGLNIMDQGEDPGIDADPGFRLGAAWGYSFNGWFGLELETALLLNSGQPRDGGSTDWFGQTPILGNLVFRSETDSDWIPYLGFGLGGIVFHDDEESGGDIAFQWKFGIRRRIDDDLSVGLGYRGMALFVTSLFSDETLGNDSITACLNWRY